MGCIVMSNINFDNVYLLLIAIPLIALFTVPFFIAVRKDNRNGHNVASQVIHVVMAIIIAFAAAGTSLTTVLTETDIYVVADVSYSANKNLDTLDGYIKNLNLPRNSKLGLVCFGKDYQLVSELGRPQDVSSVRNATVDDSETNIAEALNYTGTLFKENVIKRVVLITDGKQTDQVDAYAIRRAIDSLETLNIHVDAIFLDDNITEGTKEVQLSGAEYTRSAYLNHEENVNVTVQTTYDVRAFLRLYSGETLIQERPVNLTVGTNIVSLNLITSSGGTFDYEVRVEGDVPGEAPEGDTSDYNNTYSFTQSVSSDIKALIITGSWACLKSLVTQYENCAMLDIYENDLSVKMSEKNVYVNQIAGKSNIKIHLTSESKTNIPYSIEDLCTYDEIILAEVDLSAKTTETTPSTPSGSNRWPNYGDFIKNLDIVVKQFGKSLVTIGNLEIQSIDKGNEENKKALETLDDMLPVRFGKSEDEPKLYTFVIDVSLSMLSSLRFELTKEVVSRLINGLEDDDEVCIVTFSGDTRVALPPVSLRTGRSDAIDVINGLKLAQGTVIGKGLEVAYNLIDKLENYSGKQVMLITDGCDFQGDTVAPENIVSAMYNSGIVTSAIYMGNREDEKDNVGLENLASLGEGHYYDFSADKNKDNIDETSFAEMKETQLGYVIEDDSKVIVSNNADKVLDSEKIDKTAIPDVSGFVTSKLKASATTVLKVKNPNGMADKDFPLYAHWGYGNGKVATFTSSITGGWIKNWSPDLITAFFDNVFDTDIPKEKTDYPYNFEIQQEEGATHIRVIPANLRGENATAKIKLTMPDGNLIEEDLAYDSYYYFYDFDSSGVGKYQIEVNYSYNGRNYVAVSAINVSYAAEYNEFAAYEASVLFKAVDDRGTVSVDGSLTIVNDKNDVGTYTIDFTIPLLICFIALYVVDIVIRKLKWEDVVSFFGGLKKSKENKTGDKK